MWPYRKRSHYPYPGRLFNGKELLINVPYLPRKSSYKLPQEIFGILWMRRVIFPIGPSEGTPTLDEQRGAADPEE